VMLSEEKNLAVDLVSEIWENLQERLEEFEIDAQVRMCILGVFQHSADVFGLERSELGLPSENADILFIRSLSRTTNEDP
jgi:hypothetical protein